MAEAPIYFPPITLGSLVALLRASESRAVPSFHSLISLAVLLAVCEVWAKTRREWSPVWVTHGFTKPLTIAVLCLLPVLFGGGEAGLDRYSACILLGLALSAVADILMLDPKRLFAPGLAVFMAAHGAYIAALSPPVPSSGGGWVAVLSVSAFFLGYFYVFMRDARRLKTPLRAAVTAYIVVLGVMTSAAVVRAAEAVGEQRALLAGAGGLLFAASDAILAYDKFISKIGVYRHHMVHGTYFAAQLLLAWSYVFCPGLSHVSFATDMSCRCFHLLSLSVFVCRL